MWKKILRGILWTVIVLVILSGGLSLFAYARHGVNPLVYVFGLRMGLDFDRNNFAYADGLQTAGPRALQVKTRGHGPVPVVLIPGHGFGGEVFDSFLPGESDRFTFHAVTLPGFGGTDPWPLAPEAESFMERRWMRRSEEAIVQWMQDRGMEDAVLVGHFVLGTQLALQIAIDHPEAVRSVAVLAGESRRGGGTPEQRRGQVDRMKHQFFRWVTREVWVKNNWPAELFTRDPVRGAVLRDESNSAPLPVLIGYVGEYFATDVTAGFDRLEVPVLVLLPGFTEEFRTQPGNAMFLAFFQRSWEVAASHPRIELQTIPDAHIFLWEDEPEATRSAILGFLDGAFSGDDDSAGEPPM